MFCALRVLIWKLATVTYRYSLQHALALPPRGGVRNDGLKLKSVCNRLEIEWSARDLHPWDHDDPNQTKALKFIEQCLADTETAIDRLFEALPQVDMIDLKVRDPNSGNVIVTGTLDRYPLDTVYLSSIRMRLMARGIKYYLDGAYFEPLEPEHNQMEIA
jgi:hypothetical protein